MQSSQQHPCHKRQKIKNINIYREIKCPIGLHMKYAVVFNRTCKLKKLPENKHHQIFLLNMYTNTSTASKMEAQSSQRNNLVDWLTQEYAVQCCLFSCDPNSIQVTPGGCSVVPEMILKQSQLNSQQLITEQETSSQMHTRSHILLSPSPLFSKKNRTSLSGKLLTSFKSRITYCILLPSS